ncbi:MAG: PQQ-binding-like beta-propeller repeat protein [Spirochaetales bacterium]|nr:PQQ-binding-like beta-propeller repeat protein [Spirochaetales bacterium]
MMKDSIIIRVTTAITTVTGTIVLGAWFFQPPVIGLTTREPGTDGRVEFKNEKTSEVKIGEYFQKYTAEAGTDSGSWPAFRGKNRDNIDKVNTGLADEWPESGPRVLWSIDLGEGHAGAAIHSGRVYILDYDEARRSDALRCFSFSTGKELWRRWYAMPLKRNHGRSRTVPAVTDKFVVTIGPKGHVMCADSINGDFLWGIDLVKEYGSVIPDWYAGQCPLIDDGMAVIAPAGKSLLVGVDCGTGKILFDTPNQDNFKMSHSSVMIMNFNGKRIYLYSALGGLTGISADKHDMGRVLFTTREWTNSVIAPSPVAFPDGRIFATAGYGAGSMLLKLEYSGNRYSIKKIYSNKPEENFSSEQQTPVLVDGFLFGILPKDGGSYRNQFACYDPRGRIVWTSGKTRQFGLGPFLYADSKFFILSDDGILTMARFSLESFKVLSQVKIIEGRDCWAPLALADGKMLLRSSKKMICIDLKLTEQSQ